MRFACKTVLMLILLVLLPQAAAAQGKTFRDWYAACSETDASCRADTFVKGDSNPIGFDYRVSWLRTAPEANFVLVFNPLYEPVAGGSPITLQVTGENPVRLNDGSGYRRAADERYLVLTVTRNLSLMEQMRAGSKMALSYTSSDGEEISIEVSLLGLTASLVHIEALRPSRETAEEAAPEEAEPAEAEAEETPPEETTAAQDAPEAAADAQPEEQTGEPTAKSAEETSEETAEETVDSRQHEEDVTVIRLDADWPDDLFLFEAAIAMCLEETVNKPARVGAAWVLDEETVAVKLEPWDGDPALCLAEPDGGAVLEIRDLARSDSAPESGPTFSPIEFGKPEGCFTHEPVALEDGTPIGWLSTEGC